MEALDIILPIVYIIVGCALVWFLVELALTFHKTRNVVGDVKTQLDPTLANVEKITTDIKPAIEKVDPLVERVTLTVDAVNLEMMRVDDILGNVTKVTNTVDNVTSAPVDLVNSLTKKVRGKFGAKGASDESVKLGAEKAEKDGTAPKQNLMDDIVEATADAINGENYAKVEEQ